MNLILTYLCSMIANMSAAVQLENAVNLQKSVTLLEAGGATMMNHRSENKQKPKENYVMEEDDPETSTVG